MVSRGEDRENPSHSRKGSETLRVCLRLVQIGRHFVGCQSFGGADYHRSVAALFSETPKLQYPNRRLFGAIPKVPRSGFLYAKCERGAVLWRRFANGTDTIRGRSVRMARFGWRQGGGLGQAYSKRRNQ